jgi:nicotinamidase/pyrazinamidase
LNHQAMFADVRVVSKDMHPSDAWWIADEKNPVLSPAPAGIHGFDVHWPEHCTVGTEGSRLIPGLPFEREYDFIVNKGMEVSRHPYGACYQDLDETQSTGVIEWLVSKNVGLVLVGGLATDYCVKTTALQLKKAGFAVLVNLSACRGVSPDTTEKAIDLMKKYGIMVVDKLA